MTTQDKGRDSYAMFMGALDVFNEAMDKYRDKPLIKDILSLVDEQTAGRKFGAAVYKTEPDEPFDYFTVRLHNQRLELVSHGKDAPDIDWKVSMDYLRDINDNPQEYVSNPLKLDFDWLKHRLRDAA